MAVAASLCLDFARAAFAECSLSCLLLCHLRWRFVSSRSVESRNHRQPFLDPFGGVVVVGFRYLLPLLVVLLLLLLLLLRLVNDDLGLRRLFFLLPPSPFVAAFPSPICCALMSWMVGSSGTIACGYR